MISELLYILWNPNLVAFHLGPMSIRWYSLCWLLGLASAYFIVKRLYKEQKIKPELFDPLFIYCFVGILIAPVWATACSMSPTISCRAANI